MMNIPDRQTMTQSIRNRLLLTAQVGILVAQIVGLGFAAIAATEASTMTLSAERPDGVDNDSAFRDQVRARARTAAWQTKLETMNDLDLKLNADRAGTEQLASANEDHRG